MEPPRRQSPPKTAKQNDEAGKLRETSDHRTAGGRFDDSGRASHYAWLLFLDRMFVIYDLPPTACQALGSLAELAPPS